MMVYFLKYYQLIVAIILTFLTGTVQAKLLSQVEDTVRIGLMLSEDPETDINSREALFTVQYVANRVNERGGLNGRTLEIIYKSGAGDWGINSKKSVELIYDHDVSAIMGSLDGQNAHLTQMAITKAEVVFLATRATDPTLSNANIPWFFRVIPSDKQQAETLTEYIFRVRGLNNIAVIYSNHYDSRMAANAFNRLASEKLHYSIQTFEYDQQKMEFESLLLQLKNDDKDGIVHFGLDRELINLLSAMEKTDFKKPVFIPLTFQSELMDTDHSFEIYSVCPIKWPPQFDSGFISLFKKQFQRNPGLIAAYSYDGIQILVESIRNKGYSRREIRDRLSVLDYPTGVTGQIRFNNNGDIVNQTTICKW
ncbi:MAG: ABC transporter substrate-binding protein [Cyclobacteriaceae bacterium]